MLLTRKSLRPLSYALVTWLIAVITFSLLARVIGPSLDSTGDPHRDAQEHRLNLKIGVSIWAGSFVLAALAYRRQQSRGSPE